MLSRKNKFPTKLLKELKKKLNKKSHFNLKRRNLPKLILTYLSKIPKIIFSMIPLLKLLWHRLNPKSGFLPSPVMIWYQKVLTWPKTSTSLLNLLGVIVKLKNISKNMVALTSFGTSSQSTVTGYYGRKIFLKSNVSSSGRWKGTFGSAIPTKNSMEKRSIGLRLPNLFSKKSNHALIVSP